MSRILLVEDDHLLRGSFAMALARQGHDVIEAADGTEALERFRESAAELIITDLLLPPPLGAGFVANIRRDHPSIPVIAMSGHSATSQEFATLSAGLNATEKLTKPFTLRQLQEAVTRALA